VRSELVVTSVALVLALASIVVRAKRVAASGKRPRWLVPALILGFVVGVALPLIAHRHQLRRALSPPATSTPPSVKM
jgi:tryptophan-rich sensory protein